MQPNTQQVGGIIGGTGLSLWEAWSNITDTVGAVTAGTPELAIVKSAIIGATVGFIITTLLRLAWDNFVIRYGHKFKFLKPKK